MCLKNANLVSVSEGIWLRKWVQYLLWWLWSQRVCQNLCSHSLESVLGTPCGPWSPPVMRPTIAESSENWSGPQSRGLIGREPGLYPHIFWSVGDHDSCCEVVVHCYALQLVPQKSGLHGIEGRNQRTWFSQCSQPSPRERGIYSMYNMTHMTATSHKCRLIGKLYQLHW